MSDLMAQFEATGERHEGTPILTQTFPNNCLVEFVIDRYENTALFVYIQTIGKDCSRKGYAKTVIERILRIVDKHELNAELAVAPFGNVSANDLSKFYASFGFRFTGEYDNDLAPIMTRFKIDKRKMNPSKSKSVLGAMILGGIIGHSMKK